ncbi:ATP-binding cassette domain-containing protein [Nocardia abscessus]|uniref:ATP-binding cassette domain-containing protein n=1 Tax=Nocardia abscessus TaxID=120957 RepID=UPI0024550259|nr:ATP-binding cassette domain-containing protein [Nocardia abscessus]
MTITLRNVTKAYRGGTMALHEIDLTVTEGMTGLLGTNGAGKTTLIRILTGTIRPTSGTVSVCGHDLSTTAGRTAVKRLLGYLPQELVLYEDLTGREFLDYVALLKGIDDKRNRRSQIDNLLERVGLDALGAQRISRYSGGMKRRLGIAQTLLGDPKLIIVDEPTAGLDPEERIRFRALLGRLGGDRIVVLSTHILDDVAHSCPMAAVLTEGRIAYHGTTPGLVALAEGQTHLVRASHEPRGDFTVVNVTGTAEGPEYRIVGPTPPPGSRPISPTLDDGYIALLRTARAGRW